MTELVLDFVLFDTGIIVVIVLASLFLFAWSLYRRTMKREEYMASLMWLAAGALIISTDVLIHELMEHPVETLMLGINVSSWDVQIVERFHTAAHILAFMTFLIGLHFGLKINRFLDAIVKEKTGTLRKANAELRSLDELKSKFITNVSHETKTPMSVLLSSIEMLKAGKEKGTFDKIVNAMERNAARLRNILERSTELHLIEHGRTYAKQKVDLGRIAGEAATECRPAFERKGIRFVAEIGRLQETTGDPSALKTVIENLLDNALKFTEKGSVTLAAKMHGDGVEVSIEDTGIGMPRKEQKHIFKPFYKVRAFVSGTGASLALCKYIVEAHGGNIGFRSKPGKGSVFFFTLPIEKERRRAGKYPDIGFLAKTLMHINLAKEVKKKLKG